MLSLLLAIAKQVDVPAAKLSELDPDSVRAARRAYIDAPPLADRTAALRVLVESLKVVP